MGLPADGLVLWLLPVSWLVHDLEEIAPIEGPETTTGNSLSGKISSISQ